ncbi:MBL fold metallo-hydrolase RNA specificity domain-containing protein [Bradyrhizobium sp.]|uniref:MBL fold metallo-hydrolase RNA specificity domain-containing protein n=1 Tax=Bradyrhizobium sp. TaxID=376 RepID=UPI003918B9AC
MSLRLTFLGGAGTVTGSKYLVEAGAHRLLIDCGLFQGGRALRKRNWETFPVAPSSISAVLLTHAHLDHSGALPLLVKQGYRGPVICSEATAALCEVLLRDAGHLQEQDARYANKRGYSKYKPALPLYMVADAEAALRLFRPIRFHESRALPGDGQLKLKRAGHILGAASIKLDWDRTSTTFSGDLGRQDDPIMYEPEALEKTDYLVVESTYGDRLHEKIDPQRTIEQIVGATTKRGGTVVIPAFAVGRVQAVLYYFERFKTAGGLHNVPIFLDSPMAVDASEIFCKFRPDHRLSHEECRRACNVATYIRSIEESKRLSDSPIPKVIISASGMATGGRVLHHLRRFAPDPKNTVLFAGYQAEGTRGAQMISGAKIVRIHGQDVPVAAEIHNIGALSAHADANEILSWLGSAPAAPKTTFITHGEPTAAQALQTRIVDKLGWRSVVPELGQQTELD